jgi:tRNA threonylcarbamoyladenosine biosynthesis protein TsaB
MATAKGFCFVLKVPLISLNTLTVMAFGLAEELKEGDTLFCPMIDARRMEVYTALYNPDMTIILEPCAMMLEQGSFDYWLRTKQVAFFGSGALKWQKNVMSGHALFPAYQYKPSIIATMSFGQYSSRIFSDLAYSVPIYIKDFHTHHKN